MLEGEVTRIHDGSTFKLKDGTRIRLANVEAPNLSTEPGLIAANVLMKLIAWKTITYVPIGVSNGVIIADVKVGKISVNNEMRRREYELTVGDST